ncbi:MAG: hypothetical protein WCP15_02480 [bacterium]
MRINQTAGKTEYVTKKDLKEEFNSFEKKLDIKFGEKFSAVDRRFDEIDKKFVEMKEDNERHMGILLEAFNDNMKTFGDALKSTNEKVERHDEDIEVLKNDVHKIKAVVKFA